MITFFKWIKPVVRNTNLFLSEASHSLARVMLLQQQLEQGLVWLIYSKKLPVAGQLSAFPCAADSSLSHLSFALRQVSGLSSPLAGLLIPWSLTLALH